MTSRVGALGRAGGIIENVNDVDGTGHRHRAQAHTVLGGWEDID